MPATLSSLEHLGHPFERFSAQTAHLYEMDPAFRDLCDMHAVCVRGVKRSDASGASALAAEYAAQQVRFEAELLRRLQTAGAAAAQATGGR
jgi:hypothetical protein